MKILLVLAVVSVLVSGCASYNDVSPRTKSGAQIGGIVGGLGGLIIDSKNPWRGAVLGAAAGAVIGGVIGNIQDKAADEAARRNTEVQYERTTEQGWKETVIATPKGQEGDYKLISVKYVRDGKVVGEEIKKVPINQ